ERLVIAPQLAQSDAEIVMGLGRVGLDGERLRDQAHRLVEPCSLGAKDAKMMQGVGMGATGMQERPIELLRLAQAAALGQADSVRKRLLGGRRPPDRSSRSLRGHPFSPWLGRGCRHAASRLNEAFDGGSYSRGCCPAAKSGCALLVRGLTPCDPKGYGMLA